MARYPTGQKVTYKGTGNHWRPLLTVMVLLTGVLFFTGCGTLDTLLQKDSSGNNFGGWIGNQGNKDIPAATNSGDVRTVALYFADASGKYLVREDRPVPRTVSVARETVTEWLKGPAVKSAGVQPVVSPTTVLLDIAVKDNVATVNFSKEFLQTGSKVAPEAVLYGLANTLTQFPTIKEVRIRVEGKPLTRLGNLDAGHLTAKTNLVKGKIDSSNSNSPVNGVSGTGNTGANSGNGGSTLQSPSSVNIFDLPDGST